jgi:hypothetical protein
VDADFINVYISKQKAWIEDLLAKHIILEARIQILEKSLSDKNGEVDNLSLTLQEKTEFINKLVDANTRKNAEINNLVAEKQQVQAQKFQKKKKPDTEEQSIAADEF